MPILKLNITKRNRVFFAAKNEAGYPCKVRINEKSADLELGEHLLNVNDVSVRSKFGTDLIYELAEDATKPIKICTLQAPKNSILIAKCHELGGQWDGDAKAWIFSSMVEDEVLALDEKYNSDPITVEILATSALSGDKSPVQLAGFEIARAWGRDSGAKLAAGVALIGGAITSGGSRINWSTIVKKDSIIRMQIPKLCLSDLQAESNITVTVIEQ